MPALRLLWSVSTATEESSCPLHASWFLFMQSTLEKLVMQVQTVCNRGLFAEPL